MTSEIRDVIELFTFGGCNSYAFKTIPSCRIASPGIFENNFSTLFFLKKNILESCSRYFCWEISCQEVSRHLGVNTGKESKQTNA